MEAASSLSVKAKVLGEALGNYELEALLDKVAHSGGISSKVTRGKALVGAVKEGEVLLLPNHNGQLLPLIQCWVDTGWVVSAGVEQDDGAFGGCGNRRLHAIEIQSSSLLVPVGVLGDFDADIVEDLVVVCPCGIGYINDSATLVELGEEQSAHVDGSSSRNGLHRCGAVLLDRGGVGAEHQLRSLAGEALDTSNRGIFVVQFGVVSENFISLYDAVGSVNQRLGSWKGFAEICNKLARPITVAPIELILSIASELTWQCMG